MSTPYMGIQSATINLFRGQQAHFQWNPVNGDGNPISLDTGTTGKLVVTSSLSPDAPSVVHTFTDLYEFAGLIEKDFSQADTRLLPLGSYLMESTVDESDGLGDKVWMQGTINVFNTQMG